MKEALSVQVSEHNRFSDVAWCTLSIFFLLLYSYLSKSMFMLTDKCKAPYYGGCAHTRECESTPEEATCRNCRPGYARDPRNYTIGECLGISQTA